MHDKLNSVKEIPQGLLEKAVERLKAEFQPEEIYLFGSHAWGTPTEDSDVDLMVIGDIGLRDIAPRLRPAIDSIGREINPVVMSPAGFSSAPRPRPRWSANARIMSHALAGGRGDGLNPIKDFSPGFSALAK